MAEAADEQLVALVRQVLPPRTRPWIVQVVDRHEDAGADFVHNRLFVRRDWRSAIYEDGLFDVPEFRSIKRFFPLSVKRLESQLLHRKSQRVLTDLWEAKVLRRGTRFLTSLSGYVGRTTDRNWIAFHKQPNLAELAALQMMRSERAKRARAVRALKERNARHQAVLGERVRLRKYDGDFRVSVDSYVRWLPPSLADAYRLCEGGVPLIVIENEIIGLVPDLDDRQMADLMFQLDCDAQRADASRRAKGTCGLSERDSRN